MDHQLLVIYGGGYNANANKAAAAPPELASAMYAKTHQALNKVNSYDKATFHSARRRPSARQPSCTSPAPQQAPPPAPRAPAAPGTHTTHTHSALQINKVAATCSRSSLDCSDKSGERGGARGGQARAQQADLLAVLLGAQLAHRPPTVVRHLYIDGAAAPPRSSQLPAAPRAPRVRA
ncbi:hypothetical protein MSG28_012832 [Choristoneura fumiferana]|uniref:Uncharacterized protein n=1 Tax=Choristoneura fumiferana TaxID=7141 RepID=A0ACC0JI43_CHOFU|nr:hypothetical protein MSG28_012832 [Choristoneura fumiferana]